MFNIDRSPTIPELNQKRTGSTAGTFNERYMITDVHHHSPKVIWNHVSRSDYKMSKSFPEQSVHADNEVNRCLNVLDKMFDMLNNRAGSPRWSRSGASI
jgi:hypothetical protein